jgi:hypothetical protein
VTDERILELVYEHFGPTAQAKLLRTVWKDSIDIEEPTYELKQFVGSILAQSSAPQK